MSGGTRLALAPEVDRRLGGWLRSKTPQELALILACVPILIVLPVVSLMMFAATLGREPRREHVQRWSLVLVVAVLNILLSAWLLSELAGAAIGAVLHWWSLLPDLLRAPELQTSQLIPV